MNYASLKSNTILPLIEKYGKTVYLRSPATTVGWTKSWNAGEGRYQWENDITGEIVYSDPATEPNDIEGIAIEKKYEQNLIDGVNIFATDRRFITASFTNPTTENKLVIGTTILNIINVSPIEPGDVTLVHILQCRT